MPAAADTHPQEQAQPAEETTTVIPRWTPEFDLSGFDVQAVFKEAEAQKKSVYKLLKSLGYPVAQYVATELPEVKSAGGIPVTASSTVSDLEGDDFGLEALKQMRDAAVGSTVFLNHEYTVPEDVYGRVEMAAVAQRALRNPLTGGDVQAHCLDMNFAPVGETENPRAVQVTNMIKVSGLRLGVSVTVLVLAFKERTDGGRTITKVFYLETSIVGIPCNQTAWVKPDEAAAAAQKSLMTMPQQKSAAVAPEAAGAATKIATFFKSALVTAKAMFADVLEENRNNYWILNDSFRTVYYRLQREARGKSGEALTALINEADASVEEFAGELKQLLANEINEAATQESTFSPYYDCWSAATRLEGVLKKGLTQKAGARNSATDQALLDRAHDCIVEAGGQCAHKSADGTAGDATKQASFAGAGDHETKIASLTARIDQAERERDLALEVAETLRKELDVERVGTEAAAALLEELSQQPLPRAGSF